MTTQQENKAGRQSWALKLLVFAFISICPSLFAQTNNYVESSIIEVGSVRLEIEQPPHEMELRIRVRDYSANNHQKTNVTCDIFYVNENNKESKIGSVVLKQKHSNSEIYSGSFSTEHQFTHGTIARVSYKSPALRLPISTWYSFAFH